MKQMISLLFILSLFTSCASEVKTNSKEIPTAVLDSFKVKFPGIYLPDWTIKNKKGFVIYVARFHYSNHKIKVKFLETGKLIKKRGD